MIAALEGHQMSDHHRRMIRYSVDHMRFWRSRSSSWTRTLRRGFGTQNFGLPVNNVASGSLGRIVSPVVGADQRLWKLSGRCVGQGDPDRG